MTLLESLQNTPLKCQIFFDKISIISLSTYVFLYNSRATNEHEDITESVNIEVEKAEEVEQCIDDPDFANCALIVRAKYCTKNAYWANFCCASCTESGQLGPEGFIPTEEENSEESSEESSEENLEEGSGADESVEEGSG